MAQVTIGGQDFSVQLANFKALKAAWAHIKAVEDSNDALDGVTAILGVISVGLVGQTLSVDDLESRLLPSELPGLKASFTALIGEIGLSNAIAVTEAEDEAVA